MAEKNPASLTRKHVRETYNAVALKDLPVGKKVFVVTPSGNLSRCMVAKPSNPSYGNYLASDNGHARYGHPFLSLSCAATYARAIHDYARQCLERRIAELAD